MEEHKRASASGEPDAAASPLQSRYDEATESRIRRKLDWNLMPLVFVCCESLRRPLTSRSNVQREIVLMVCCARQTC